MTRAVIVDFSFRISDVDSYVKLDGAAVCVSRYSVFGKVGMVKPWDFSR